MRLDELSLTYKCHCAIGNSLDLEEMASEVMRTFIKETFAVGGIFFLKEACSLKKVVEIGKHYDYERALLEESNECIIDYENHIKLLILDIKTAKVLFFYKKSDLDLEFIYSMFESLADKLDISVDSCLNVEKLKKKNEDLQSLTYNLQDMVDKKVAENKEKERQLFEQSKMAQMGEMIGNIAHQWRQPLSVISTAASGLKLKKELGMLEDSEFFEFADSIVENTMFLSNTIDEFRDYIEESHRVKEVVLQDRLKMAISLVESSFAINNISLIKEKIESEPIHIYLILGELLQVLVSIFNNAKDVLVDREIEKKWVKYSLQKLHDRALITIEDNGGGIDKDIMTKIFAPYFTTKHKSQGTGIGLYTSYDIIVNHLKGNLYVRNSENGAKFFIELPLK